MGPTGCPESSVTDYKSTLRNILEEPRPHLRRDGKLKSRKKAVCDVRGGLVCDEVNVIVVS